MWNILYGIGIAVAMGIAYYIYKPLPRNLHNKYGDI